MRISDEALAARIAAQCAVAEPLRRAAEESLAEQIDGLTVSIAGQFHSPTHIRSLRQFLTLAQPANLEPQQVVRQFVAENATLIGIGPDELNRARLTRAAQTARTGLWSLIWQQSVMGRDLVGAELRATVTADGRLVSIGSTMLTPPHSGFTFALPTVDPVQAVRFAAVHLGVALETDATIVPSLTPSTAEEHWLHFIAPAELATDLYARIVAFARSASEIVPAYEVWLGTRDGASYYVVVDALSGELLLRASRTLHAEPATYRAYVNPATLIPLDSPRPAIPGPDAPETVDAAEVPRSLVTLDALDDFASPAGWLPPDANTTRGNNARVYLNTVNDDVEQPSDYIPTVVPRVFDFPIDLSAEPVASQGAALSHAFYVTNWWHDRVYQLGFTEAFANFQDDNFGRGGEGGDAIAVQAQDASRVNNASYSFANDGRRPTVRMHLFDGAAPDRDGTLDTVVLIHELTHGLTTRIIGIAGMISFFGGLQSAGMGEGWSDFYALALLAPTDLEPDSAVAAGTYVTRSWRGSDTNTYFGIRRYPYSTDFAKNPLTFNDIDIGQFDVDPTVPASAANENSPGEVHAIGEVWCNVLWEMRAALIESRGPAGAELALQLVTDGIKLCPAMPSFIDARDGILLADLAANNAENWPALWSAFARRGLGGAARSGSPFVGSAREAFDVPVGPRIVLLNSPSTYEPRNAVPMVRIALADAQSGAVADAVVALNVAVDGQPQIVVPMLPGALANEYLGTFPILPCGTNLRWHLSVQTAAGVSTLPSTAPAAAFSLFVADRFEAIFEDDFEQDRGWTVESSAGAESIVWVRAEPSQEVVHPIEDHTVNGSICYRAFGPNGGANGGTSTLDSPPLDLSASDVFVDYHRWTVNLLNSGGSGGFEIALLNSSEESIRIEFLNRTDSRWKKRTIRVSDLTNPEAAMRLRFTNSGAAYYSAVDDVSVRRAVCDPDCPGDVDDDRDVDLVDLATLLTNFGTLSGATRGDGDLDGDAAVTLSDLARLLAQFGSVCE